jgi:hypothetical protein
MVNLTGENGGANTLTINSYGIGKKYRIVVVNNTGTDTLTINGGAYVTAGGAGYTASAGTDLIDIYIDNWGTMYLTPQYNFS